MTATITYRIHCPTVFGSVWLFTGSSYQVGGQGGWEPQCPLWRVQPRTRIRPARGPDPAYTHAHANCSDERPESAHVVWLDLRRRARPAPGEMLAARRTTDTEPVPVVDVASPVMPDIPPELQETRWCETAGEERAATVLDVSGEEGPTREHHAVAQDACPGREPGAMLGPTALRKRRWWR
jgi:hypothetical protein